MFSNQHFSENENNSLHITDMSPQALREMLRFLYTDKMQNANLHAKGEVFSKKLVKFFEFRRLLIACSAELFQSEVSKIKKVRQAQ